MPSGKVVVVFHTASGARGGGSCRLTSSARHRPAPFPSPACGSPGAFKHASFQQVKRQRPSLEAKASSCMSNSPEEAMKLTSYPARHATIHPSILRKLVRKLHVLLLHELGCAVCHTQKLADAQMANRMSHFYEDGGTNRVNLDPGP